MNKCFSVQHNRLPLTEFQEQEVHPSDNVTTDLSLRGSGWGKKISGCIFLSVVGLRGVI